MKDIIKFGALLMIMCAVAAAALSGTYIITSPIIAGHKTEQLNQSLKEVLPSAGEFKLSSKKIDGREISYYLGSKNNKRAGVVIPVSKNGYAGPIDMLVGIDTNNKVTGVRILKMQETPGLGLKASGPKFISQFINKTISDKLKAKLDIQAITGATITSQAVCEGVRAALAAAKGL